MKKIICILLMLLFISSAAYTTKAEETKEWEFKIIGQKIYSYYNGEMKEEITDVDFNSFQILNNKFAKDKNKVFINAIEGPYSYTKAGEQIIDIESFQALSDLFSKDKNNVYSIGCQTWDSCYLVARSGLDPSTFQSIGGKYYKDKNNYYYYGLKCVAHICSQDKTIITAADPDSFEILSEDNRYAMDINNMYLSGKVLNEAAEQITNNSIYQNLKGKIVLKVEDSGEAYYVHPTKKEMHFLSRPVVAFYVMREQGVGISNSNLEKIPVADNYCPSYSPNCDDQTAYDINFTKEQAGKIFLQVEENGEAWYVNPNDHKRYFLGRPTDAFNVMRNLGLGISNNDFDKL